MKTMLRHIVVMLLVVASHLTAVGQSHMVVVTTKGDMQAYPASQVEGIEYDQQTDTYTLVVGGQAITYSADDLHNISYDDRYLVDMDSYIVPADDDTQNPNLIVPGQENTYITELDTARFCATVEFKNEVPKLYVGSILMLQNDTIVVPCYVLTHEVIGKTAHITYRNAELGEIFYNQTFFFGDEQDAEQVRRKAPGKGNIFGLRDRLVGYKEKLDKVPFPGISLDVKPSFSFRPTYYEELSAPYGEGREKRAKAYYKKVIWEGTMSLDTDLKISLGTSVKLAKQADLKGSVSKNFTVMVGYVPVLLTVRLQPKTRAELSSSAEVFYTQNFQHQVDVTATMEYNGFLDEWSSPDIKTTPVSKQGRPSYFGTEGKVEANVFPVYPELTVEVYHALGAGVAVRPYFKLNHTASTKSGHPFTSSSLSFNIDAVGEIYARYPFSSTSRKTLLDFGPYNILKADMWASPRKVVDLGGRSGVTRSVAPRRTHILEEKGDLLMCYRDQSTIVYQLQDLDQLSEAYVETACRKGSIEQQWFSDMPHDRRTPLESDSALVSEGLYPVSDPVYTESDENGYVRAELNCPAPGSYRRVLLTRLLDGEGHVIYQTTREMGAWVKNFNATYTAKSADGTIHGSVEYRDDGRYIVDRVDMGGMTAVYTTEDGNSTMTITMPNGMTVTNPVPSGSVPAALLCRRDYREWDRLFYEELNGYADYPELIGVGFDTVLGRPCKTVTLDDGSKNYFWHNLCLKAQSTDVNFNVTSLEVLDK